MPRSHHVTTLLAAAALALVAARPSSAADKCLEGASTASDTQQIAEVRAVVETFCDCDLFDGLTPETTHGKYVKCASSIVVARAKAGRLRNQCKGLVKKTYAKSACGFKTTANGDKVPCVKKLASTGKVTCAIKPSGACTSNPGVFTQAACTDTFTCLDSADSSGNLFIDPADSGACVDAFGPVVGTTRDIPSGAEPPHTPGTAGVVVTNLKLLSQFGGPDFSLNNARYTRYRFSQRAEEPDAILVTVPGFVGGATGFKIFAENLLARALADEGLTVEVWAVDRRTNQLEDLAGLQLAEKSVDAFAALDWLFGDELGFLNFSPILTTGPSAPNRRAFFYNNTSETGFMANWTNLVFSRDIDAVVQEARLQAANQNVFLGGHSAGTGFAARYASTDFNLTGVGPADPGYARLRGLVLLEGGGGSTGGTPLTADSLDRIEAKANGGLYAAVQANAPRCADGVTPCTIATEATDCAGSTPPKCTLPTPSYTGGLPPLAFTPRLLMTVEVAGIQGNGDLNGSQSLLQVDYSGADTSAIDLVPDLGLLSLLPDADVAGSLGNFLDDDGLAAAAGAFFVATSLGAPGPVVSGLATWLDLDDSGSFPTCPGAGCVTPDNGAPPTSLPAGIWGQEKEVSRMDRVAAAMADGGSNFTDCYYPQAGPSTTSVAGICSSMSGTCTVGNVGAACSGGTQAAANAQCNQSINLDSSALSIGRGRRDIENLTQAANIDIPVIAFGGSNGLTTAPGSFVAFANSIGTCVAPSCDGTPRVVDATTPNPAFPTLGDVNGGFEAYISEGFGHVDVLTSEDDANNNVIAPLVAFIERNVIP